MPIEIQQRPGGNGGCGGGTTTLLAWFYDHLIGSWAFGVDTTFVLNGCLYGGSDGLEIHWYTYLGAGTYTLTTLTNKSNYNGIVDIYIDAVEVASFDLYDSSTELKNQLNTQSSITVASSGVKEIKFVIDGKNGSSNGYRAKLQALVFYRTA